MRTSTMHIMCVAIVCRIRAIQPFVMTSGGKGLVNLDASSSVYFQLADFGSSLKVKRYAGHQRSAALAKLVTTVAYASPQSLQGEEIDFGHDVWSLGMLILQLLQEHPEVPSELIVNLRELLRTSVTHVEGACC